MHMQHPVTWCPAEWLRACTCLHLPMCLQGEPEEISKEKCRIAAKLVRGAMVVRRWKCGGRVLLSRGKAMRGSALRAAQQVVMP